MPKRWRIANHDVARIAQLESSAGVPMLVAQLLIGRGFDCPTAVRQFLDAKLTDLVDPQELPGVPQAAELLFRAVHAGRQIVVYGDYDADGMTATAILVRCLRLLNAKVQYYVPHRLDEGYGLNCESLEVLASQSAEVVVTVDNGIASLAEADRARELGLELVVTDHHELAASLPDAAAIVHPKLPGSDYPFKELCGAAIAFKLAWALCQLASEGKRVRPALRDFLVQATGLAAIGTVADVVPLVHENRVLVRHGLTNLTLNPTAGIAALKALTGLDKKPLVASDDIAFTIGPRLNATGRLGRAELGVELLTTDDPQRAADLASFIDELNDQRQSLERSLLLAARKQVKHRFDPQADSALVLADHGWHAGIIGIVAGKLVDQYHRPVVMISQDKLGVKPGVGSGRSVPGFHLHRALAACSEQLVSHGGHEKAVGFKIDDRCIDGFREALCSIAAAEIAAADRIGEIVIDAEAPFSALTRQNLEQIECLAPFGEGNRRPILCATDVTIAGPPKIMGKTGRHLSVDLDQHGLRLRGVAFGRSEWLDDLASARQPISVAFQPVLNCFRGRVNVELHLVDWRIGPEAGHPG